MKKMRFQNKKGFSVSFSFVFGCEVSLSLSLTHTHSLSKNFLHAGVSIDSAASAAIAAAAAAFAAASAVANLNAEASAAQNPADAQKTTLVAQQQLVPALGRLAQGTVKPEAFAAATAPEGLRQSLQTAFLPGVLDAAPKDGGKSGSSGKLSKGGAVAIGVLVPLVVLTVAGVAAVALSRRRRGPVGAHATERLPTARA